MHTDTVIYVLIDLSTRVRTLIYHSVSTFTYKWYHINITSCTNKYHHVSSHPLKT